MRSKTYDLLRDILCFEGKWMYKMELRREKKSIGNNTF